MKRAAFYVRISTLDQHPETQLRELRVYAQLTHPFCGKRIPGG